MLMIIQDFLLQIEREGTPFKFTDLMEKLLKWDERIQIMTRVDTNQSILQIWKNKYMVNLALNAMTKLLNLWIIQLIDISSNVTSKQTEKWKNDNS